MPTLVMKYIFLHKYSTSEVFINSPFENIFSQIFHNSSTDTFELNVEGNDNTIEYISSCKNNGATCHLTLSFSSTSARCAKVLSEANYKLNRGKHRKDYNIILSFDGVSEYYCNKIYSKFNQFERNIRNLIFNIMVELYGIKWYEHSVDKSIDSKLKEQTHGMSKDKLIENALHEMTISQLEDYLFTPFSNKDITQILESDLNSMSLETKTKEEIIELLDTCRSECLWERFFNDKVEIENLQEILSEIREYRNRIAHSKSFYYDDYKKCNGILNKTNKQLSEAIEVSEFGAYINDKDLENLALGIQYAMKFVGTISDVFTSIATVMKSLFEQ